ncbi:MAG: hypothetical protein ACTSQH_02910 [Candidatus Hodarchaeales archaeon]
MYTKKPSLNYKLVDPITRIAVDTSKPDISTLRLFLKREFIIYFIIPPTLISIILGLVGIRLFLQSDPFTYSYRSSSQSMVLLLFGYTWCLLSAFLSTKILYSKNLGYSIYRPRTIINALGISAFFSYILGATIASYFFPPEYVGTLYYDVYSETAVYFSGSCLFAWLLGGFIVIYAVLINKIDFRAVFYLYSPYTMRGIVQPLQYPSTPKLVVDKFCSRCGKGLPARAKFCDSCAYPVGIPRQKEISFKRVSFKQATELLDSDAYISGKKMDIEFECVVGTPASQEKVEGAASYLTVTVTDPARLFRRTLHVWGDHGHRYNIKLISSLKEGDRLLVIGPRKPRDSSVYKDHYGKDVFWIEMWDGTISDSGTRLLKLEDVSALKQEEEELPVHKKDVVVGKSLEFTPSTSSIQPPFYCQLCSVKHPAGTPRMQCESCGRFVCVEAFAEMVKVGRSSCPMCDGTLTAL